MMMRDTIFGLRAMEAVFYRLHMREMLVHQFHELLVLEMAGGADDYIAGRKPLFVEIQHRIALKFLYRVFVPRIGLPRG